MTVTSPRRTAELPARELQRRLVRRHASSGQDTAPPSVVPLGTSDAFAPEDDLCAAGRPRATVHLTAQAVLIGPWGNTTQARGCGRCLAIRWQRLRTRSARDALETGSATTIIASWPLLPDFVVDAVWAIHQAVFSDDQRPLGADLRQVTRLDLTTLVVHTFPLLAEPLCPSCGEPEQPVVPPEQLQRRDKPAPNAYRLRSPSSYPLPIDALANPVCGALGAGFEINVTSPTTAPVAGNFVLRGYTGLRDIVWSGQHHSFGSSRTLALLEGLERYAGTIRRHRDRPIVDTLANLGGSALDPELCGLYSPEAYESEPFLQRFSPDVPIPWLWGYSLRDERPILVPARLCYYGPSPAADNFVFESSNGCATGSCLEEAILVGLLELIERDAFLLGWYGGTAMTEIDLAASVSGTVRSMLDRADMLGYDVRAIDNRIDLGVPVVTGVAVRRDGGPGSIAFGAGAGLDPETAIEAALSEVLTYVPHLPRQVQERRRELSAMAEDFSLVRELHDHAQLFGLPEMSVHAARYLRPAIAAPVSELYADDRRSTPRTNNLLDDIAYCMAELARIGVDPIVVDQTTAEQRGMGLRTVRVLAPGLLPIDFGWARQRALRMPRLRSAMRTGAELHLVPHPFP